MSNGVEGLIFKANFEPSSPEQEFVTASTSQFESIRSQPNYLERMVLTAEGLGETYIKQAVGKLDPSRFNHEALINTIISKDFGGLETDKTKKDIYDTAVQIGRQTEEVRRAMMYTEILSNPDGFTPVEKILLVGSLALSQLTDTIYFDEWEPQIRDSDIGIALAQMEDIEKGSAISVLPGISDNSRWFTRKLKDPQGKLEKDNVILVPYRDSLASVPQFISVLDSLAQLLKTQTEQDNKDFGYASFFKAWSDCLKAEPENQKQAEDAMMTAWRKIDSEVPVFVVPWAENDYFDPAGVAIAPAFRFGVLSSDERTQKLIVQGQEVQQSILRFINKKGFSGSKAVTASHSVHRVWSGSGGTEVVFTPSSQILPNDDAIRRDIGCYIMPNLRQTERGMGLREKYAGLVYPPEIERRLGELKFSLEEFSVNEFEAHEFFHPVGVLTKGMNRLGKITNLMEEWKSTLGGLFAQVWEKDENFAKRGLATLLYGAAPYLRHDGNNRSQGYANIGRAVLTISESVGILTTKNGEWQLDIDNPGKISAFWQRAEEYVAWCCSAYKHADEADDKDVAQVVHDISSELSRMLGYGDKAKDGEDKVSTIIAVKTIYAKS